MTVGFAAARHGHAVLRLEGLDGELQRVAMTFGKTMNMFMGWVYGNSPVPHSRLAITI